MELTKSRNTYFDIFKAILMFCVILGHCIETGLLTDNNTVGMAATYIFVYLFHMPAFIFLFGYFSKSTAGSSRKLLSRMIMFIVLFAVGKSLYYGGFKLLNGEFPAWKSDNFWSEDSVPWYMLSAALLSASLWVARKIPAWIMLPATFILGIFCGGISGIGAAFTLSRTLIYLPIFLLGYYFPKDFFDRFLAKKRDWVWLGTLAMLTVWVLIWIWLCEDPSRYAATTPILYCNNNFVMLDVNFRDGALIRLIFYIVTLFMSACAAMTAAGISYHCKGDLLPRMGRNTLAVYLVHYPLFLLAIKILGYGVSPATGLLILLFIQVFWSLDLWEKAIRSIQKGAYWLLGFIFREKDEKAHVPAE